MSAVLIWNANDFAYSEESLEVIRQLIGKRHKLLNKVVISSKKRVGTDILSSQPYLTLATEMTRASQEDYIYVVACGTLEFGQFCLEFIKTFEVSVVLLHSEPILKQSVIDSVTEYLLLPSIFEKPQINCDLVLDAIYQATQQRQEGFLSVNQVSKLLPANWYKDLGFDKMKLVWQYLQQQGLVVTQGDVSNLQISLSMRGFTHLLESKYACPVVEGQFAPIQQCLDYLKINNQAATQQEVVKLLRPFCGFKTGQYVKMSQLI